MSSVIVLEFNELAVPLMKRFMAAGQLPNFKRLHDNSRTYITDAGVSAPYLEPWIQWVTVHTGLPYSDHQVFNLGDAQKFQKPRLWDLVSKNGGRVWVCGSMNAGYSPGLKGEVLPDPWSVKTELNDDQLKPYMEFVRGQVQRYDDPNNKLTLASALKFGGFMLRHGLRFKTISAILSQLISERFGNTYWRRAFILDRLQFDLFRHGYLRHKPKLSTLFLNSTAHLQHVYWRNLEPDSFQIKPSEAEQKAYQNAVLDGYRSMDTIVGEVMEFAGSDCTVVLATALSQQPCLSYEETGGKTFYKVIDFARLLDFIGIPKDQVAVEPVMSEEFHLRFTDEANCEQAFAHIGAVLMDDRPAFKVKRDNLDLLVGCCVYSEIQGNPVLVNSSGSKREFFDLMYHVDIRKSGMHHPDGIFWVNRAASEQTVKEQRVPLEAVAPTLLSLMGIKPPDWMKGKNLV
jgi:hypothetical protein